MSNNSNYIQATENVQQKDKNIQTFKITKQQFEENKFLNDTIKNPRYAIGFLYLITHKETGYMYSGSKLAYSIEDAITYCGSSKGKTISDICTKDKILQNGIDQYEFKLIMFCNSCEQMRELEDELNHFNIYFNKLKCLNGKGRTLRSNAGISPTQKARQKTKNTWINKTKEEKSIISKKISQLTKGENNPMYGKNPLENKTEDELKEIKQKKSYTWNNKTEEEMNIIKNKMSDAHRNKKFTKEHKEKLSISNKGKNKGKTAWNKGKKSSKYYCPYDHLIIKAPKPISTYIKKNYPNEKQWSEFTKEEKESYLVVSQDDAGLIAN